MDPSEYFRSEQFQEDFRKQVEKDTWDNGLPMVYLNEEGNIVRHYKDGKIEIIKQKNMDKLIIVHYIDVRGIHYTEVPEHMEYLKNNVIPKDDNILYYFIPINGETRIECINPKVITGEEYKEIQKFLDYQTQYLNDFLNKMKEDGKEHI